MESEEGATKVDCFAFAVAFLRSVIGAENSHPFSTNPI